MEHIEQDFVVQEVIPASAAGRDFIDWNMFAVGAPSAWLKTKGKGIKVAVLDTGIDPDHRDLAGNVKAHVDFTGSRHGSEDVQGHGTHCAGVIGAMENDLGMVGVAPEVELYSAKVLGDNGSGGYDSIVKGIRWAMEMGVDVISMSLGSSSKPPAFVHQAIKDAYNKGIVLVAATGNENSPVCWPAAFDEVIAVSAVDQVLQRAKFSNYGIQNEIAAPGVDIVSTYKNGTYARLSGTSMATPLVAGAVALIIARHKDLMNGIRPQLAEVYQILETMVRDLGVAGRDHQFGKGMIDLSKLP